MTHTNYKAMTEHLQTHLGYDLSGNGPMRIGRKNTLSDWGLVGPLCVVYRYAEKSRQKLVAFDMMTEKGHLSHAFATEMDFDYDFPSGKRNPVMHIMAAADLMWVRAAMQQGHHLKAFRMGVYFDVLNSKTAKGTRSFEDFKSNYSGGETASSMHLGLRYKWKSDAYEGNDTSSNYGRFTFWGRGGKAHGQADDWFYRLRSWPCGHIRFYNSIELAKTILQDFAILDANPPA